MAIHWFKMRPNLESHIVVFNLSDDLGISEEEVVYLLYRFASWAATHGKYGVMALPEGLADYHFKTPGLEEQLIKHGWMKRHGEASITLHYFTDVSAVRKALGTKLRKQALGDGVCRACGATEQIEIDHIVPISRGGSCKLENLQPLCKQCNVSKGQKTMEEFLNDR